MPYRLNVSEKQQSALEHFSLQTTETKFPPFGGTALVRSSKKVSTLPVTFVRKPHQPIQLQRRFSSPVAWHNGQQQEGTEIQENDVYPLIQRGRKPSDHENELLFVTEIKFHNCNGKEGIQKVLKLSSVLDSLRKFGPGEPAQHGNGRSSSSDNCSGVLRQRTPGLHCLRKNGLRAFIFKEQWE